MTKQSQKIVAGDDPNRTKYQITSTHHNTRVYINVHNYFSHTEPPAKIVNTQTVKLSRTEGEVTDGKPPTSRTNTIAKTTKTTTTSKHNATTAACPMQWFQFSTQFFLAEPKSASEMMMDKAIEERDAAGGPCELITKPPPPPTCPPPAKTAPKRKAPPKKPEWQGPCTPPPATPPPPPKVDPFAHLQGTAK